MTANTAIRNQNDAAIALSLGKRVRLHRLLFEHGPGTGTLMILPLDHGMEHGPGDFLGNPPAADPDFQFRLAAEGGYSAIAVGPGLAERYLANYAGRVPLILKLNGKTNIPDDAEATSPLMACVEDAVRLGADAVGYTLYVASPRQDDEIRQYQRVKADCERFGMPLMMWSYPRGRAIEAKGGKGTLYAIDYAARVALELGADIVKLHEPGAANESCPAPYRALDESAAERLARVVRSAGRCLPVFSGGTKLDSGPAVLESVRRVMESGAAGIVFGRNMWQLPYPQALDLSLKAREILARYGRPA
jgi:fructose-bisphosphate aldolase, class I